jgi:eukaryotic-like serine/threonine-protein kinase
MKNALIICIALLMIGAVTFAIAETKGGGFSGASGVQDGWNDNSVVSEVGFNTSPGRERLSKAVGEAKEKATPTPSTNTKNTTTSKTPEGMVKIPAGWFYMGCVPGDSKCDDNEKPRKRVYLDAYYMDVHETRVLEYQECVQAGVCEKPRTRSDSQYCNWGYSNRGDHPINCVNWQSAKTFCEWKGKKLPTEAQWEKAARGSDGRIYPWGDASPTCHYTVFDSSRGHGGDGCGKDRTWPVMSKEPGRNPFGLFDMAGNVYEWCEDWYDDNYYSRMPKRNPLNRTKANFRVIRGGSWISFPRGMRVSNRYWIVPPYGSKLMGFRCSRD